MTEKLLAYKRMPVWTGQSNARSCKESTIPKRELGAKLLFSRDVLFVEMSEKGKSQLSTPLKLV